MTVFLILQINTMSKARKRHRVENIIEQAKRDLKGGRVQHTPDSKLLPYLPRMVLQLPFVSLYRAARYDVQARCWRRHGQLLIGKVVLTWERQWRLEQYSPGSSSGLAIGPLRVRYLPNVDP